MYLVVWNIAQPEEKLWRASQNEKTNPSMGLYCDKLLQVYIIFKKAYNFKETKFSSRLTHLTSNLNKVITYIDVCDKQCLTMIIKAQEIMVSEYICLVSLDKVFRQGTLLM